MQILGVIYVNMASQAQYADTTALTWAMSHGLGLAFERIAGHARSATPSASAGTAGVTAP